MIRSAAITNIGMRRQMNQDSFFVSDSAVGHLSNLYIVADGMGGHRAGDYASKYVTRHVVKTAEDSFEQDPKRILNGAFHRANHDLRQIAASDEKYFGMGTTAVAATVTGRYLQVANVGDSRLYVFDPSKPPAARMIQITVDHSLVEEMVLAGSLDSRGLRNHPNKNIITRAIGAEDTVEVDFFTVELEPGQLILMCTDGLTNMVEDARIADILSRPDTVETKARDLVSEANRSGGKDNITVVIIDPFCGTGQDEQKGADGKFTAPHEPEPREAAGEET